MLLNENEHNRLNAIIIKSSQNNEKTHSKALLIETNTHRKNKLNSTVMKAMNENPMYFPIK